MHRACLVQSTIQGVGVALTFWGLWMYNAKVVTARGETRWRGVQALWEGALPVMHSFRGAYP